MASLSSLYKKNKGMEQPTSKLDSDSILQIFSNVIPKVNVFSTNSRIFAKESMNMPMMARDTNITRQNISKLVKLQGGTPVKKADSFFERAGEREKLYESSFSKESSALKKRDGGGPIKPSKFAQKAVDYGMVSLGLVGFFGAITLAGKLISSIPGGLDGMKNMLVALAEGLSAFSVESFLKFSALLAGGAIFGSVAGISKSIGGGIGIAAIGLGIGGFFSGLALGGAIGDMIGNSAGIRDMMTHFAEGLNAFSGDSFTQFAGLLAAGGLFGAVAGNMGSFGAMAGGGAMLGMGLVGMGFGAFFSGLSIGGAMGTTMLQNPTMIRDLLINVAGGLEALSTLDGGALISLVPVLPLFGASLVGFLGLQGMAGVLESIGDGISTAINFIFGEGKRKGAIQKVIEDIDILQKVNPDVAKIGKGFVDLLSGIKILADLTDDQLEKALKNGALALTLAEKLSKGQVQRPTPVSGGGSGLRNSDDPRRLDYNTSNVSVQIGPNGEFASKNDFLLKMYPLAIQAAKDLGGIDPSALLTQWGFESAWGKKVTGKHNYFGIKADPSWKGESVNTTTTEYIAGEKKILQQSFRSYNSPEEAVADYVNFLRNNKRYERAGLFATKTSEEYFAALQKAGYATDPNYAKKLASATEQTSRQVAGLSGGSAPPQPSSVAQTEPQKSVGGVIASTSSAITQAAVQMNSVPPTVVVNADKETEKKSQSSETKLASTIDFDFTDTMFGASSYA